MNVPTRLLLLLVTAAVYGLFFEILCWVAGTRELPYFAWLLRAQMLFGTVSIFLIDGDLLRERMKPGGTDQDRNGLRQITVLFLAQTIIAALDVGRWHWLDTVPLEWRPLLLALHLLSSAAMTWTMAVNRYFSSAVRLQPDRGQRVITTGPYAWVRHPGYSFGTIVLLTQGLYLGSWLTLIPTALMVAIFYRRTLLEEAILEKGLDGYRDYERKVVYRWIPGVW